LLEYRKVLEIALSPGRRHSVYRLRTIQFRAPGHIDEIRVLQHASPPQGAWQIGIERPDTERAAAMILELEHGALATSGDSRRFLLKAGIRYGHILDPRTRWPVPNAPRSVTVAASSCTEAGLISTLALLQGAGAQALLDEQGVRYWLLH